MGRNRGQARRNRLTRAQWHLQVARGGATRATRVRTTAADVRTPRNRTSHWTSSAHCKRQGGALSLSGTLFFDTNTTQRTLISATTPAGEFTSILSPDTPAGPSPGARRWRSTFVTFVAQGLWHVWIGLRPTWPSCSSCCFPACYARYQRAAAGKPSPRSVKRRATSSRSSRPSRWRIPSPLALAATGTVNIPVRPVEVRHRGVDRDCRPFESFPRRGAGAPRPGVRVRPGTWIWLRQCAGGAGCPRRAAGADAGGLQYGRGAGAAARWSCWCSRCCFAPGNRPFTPGVSCRRRLSGPQWPAPHWLVARVSV